MNASQNTTPAAAPSNNTPQPIIFSALEYLDQHPEKITREKLRAILAFAFLPVVNGIPIPESVAWHATAIIDTHAELLGINLSKDSLIDVSVPIESQIEQIVWGAKVLENPDLPSG